MIQPGTTETHSFVIPFALEAISKVIVTYRQNEYNVIEKTFVHSTDENVKNNNECFSEKSDTETKLTYILSQEESLRFANESDCYIQLNVISGEGALRFSSVPIRELCGYQYHKDVIV